MWIREGFTDPPRGARTAIALAWARTLGLAIAAVCLGATLDRALAGEALLGPLALLVLAVLGAAVAGGIAEALPSRIQGREETAWRDRVVAALLAGALRAGRPTGHPGGHPGGRQSGGSAGRSGGHPGGAPSHAVSAHAGPGRPTTAGAGQSGGHPGGAPGGRPGGHPGGHPGGRPDGLSAPGPSASGSAAIEGAAVDAATTGVEKIANYRAVFLAPTLAAFTAPLLVLAVWMLGIDLVSGLGLCVFIALVPVLIRAAGSRLRRPNHEYRRRESEATARYLEMIEGLGTFKVLGAMGRARDDFARSARSAMSELGRLLGRNQLMIIVNDLLFGFLMTGAALALILWRLTDGAITVGQAFAALLLTVLLAEPIDKVGRTFYIGLAGRARREGLEAMLPAAAAASTTPVSAAPSAAPAAAPGSVAASTRPSAADPAGSRAQDSGRSATDPAGTGPSAPAVSIRDLSVSLGGREILHDIDLDLPAGAHIALVGPTGAGKSTLLRVLAGLDHLEATTQVSGTILIDGVEHDSAARRAGAAVVAQKAQLASTTVGDNLHLAAPDADDAALTAALARAHLGVDTLAGGLDTPVGDSGAQLSGGQRRRVTLARALLRPRPLLLLDEPTADLDRRTEAMVRDTLAAEGRGRTVVHVAHRLDMIAGADLVVVLRDGRIEETGTFAELADRPGYLADALAAEEVRR